LAELVGKIGRQNSWQVWWGEFVGRIGGQDSWVELVDRIV